MSWLGHLTLNYRREGDQTLAHDRHEGPLRVLKRLYPEGPGICHHVLVHPPGGIVGGDVLAMEATLQPGTHALITTPGATRFYKSAGALAEQTLTAKVMDGARLEWLPLETIAYRGCQAENRLRFELAPGAEMMGWDVLALGLPTAQEAFDSPGHDHGQFSQHIELPGVWVERGTVRGRDALLLDSPLGWAGRRVMGTMWFAAGQALAQARREALLEVARELIDAGSGELGLIAGATAAHDEVIVLRALGERVEPVMQLLTSVWARWRETGWALAPCPSRVWRT
jgi:urease accessory protein